MSRPKRGAPLRLKEGVLVQPEFTNRHGYIFTFLGSYPAMTTSGDIYRVRSMSSGHVVHMFEFELEEADVQGR